MANNLITSSNNKIPSVENIIVLPRMIEAAGPVASKRFLEFFAVTIRNKNTRAAYMLACRTFFKWADEHQLGELLDIEPIHIASYIEQMTETYEAPTVKQHLAALRMLFDWLVTGHILHLNPAHAVRGPAHSQRVGKTPVLMPEQARQLIDGIDLKNAVAYRDQALIGLMVFSFARISAALSCRVGDYAPRGKRWWLTLREKGGKRHEMPVHHTLEQYLDEYLDYADLRGNPKAWLFKTGRGRSGKLTDNQLDRVNAWQMVRRRARQAGIIEKIGNHSFRATGITAYLNAGGSLENAQGMAAHSDPKTTKLYDRTNDEVSLDEVERIVI
ncbi:MAG: tyrosine-type recombinase/integrase [Rhizobiaceae bacterium]